MFSLPSSVRIYVASEATDLRRGFDGLSALTRSVIGADPMSGHLFVFINRSKDRIKILAWDRSDRSLGLLHGKDGIRAGGCGERV
jgi:transposase